jgi:hypothetical protein
MLFGYFLLALPTPLSTGADLVSGFVLVPRVIVDAALAKSPLGFLDLGTVATSTASFSTPAPLSILKVKLPLMPVL